jgi:hypothetical protein
MMKFAFKRRPSQNESSGHVRNSRSLHCATPDFLLRLIALTNFMRLSEKKQDIEAAQELWVQWFSPGIAGTDSSR